jgi:hypothetical protein
MRHAVGALAVVALVSACMTRPAPSAMPGPECARANTDGHVYKVKDFCRVEAPPGIYTIEGYVIAYDQEAGTLRIGDRPPEESTRRRELALRVAGKRSLEVGARYRFDVRVHDADEPWLVGCGLADARLATP